MATQQSQGFDTERDDAAHGGIRYDLNCILKDLSDMAATDLREEHSTVLNIIRDIEQADIKMKRDAMALRLLTSDIEEKDTDVEEDVFVTVRDKLQEIYTDPRLRNVEGDLKTQITETKNILSKALENNADDDDDIIVAQGASYVNKDPLSMRPIDVPVKNKHCGHVYDKTTILSCMESQKKRRMLCPVAGCSNKKQLEASDMEAFPHFFDFCK